jgi:hypothetical protein
VSSTESTKKKNKKKTAGGNRNPGNPRLLTAFSFFIRWLRNNPFVVSIERRQTMKSAFSEAKVCDSSKPIQAIDEGAKPTSERKVCIELKNKEASSVNLPPLIKDGISYQLLRFLPSWLSPFLSVENEVKRNCEKLVQAAQRKRTAKETPFSAIISGDLEKLKKLLNLDSDEVNNDLKFEIESY